MFRSVWLGIPILVFLISPTGSQALEIGQVAEIPRFVDSPPGFEAACAHYRWLCSSESGEGVQPGDEALRRLSASVNRDVNHQIEQKTDREIYGVAEKWTRPAGGRGDCEDLALEKMRRLLDHGVPAERLSMAIVLDWRGDNHAVLLMRLDGGVLVLDSLTDRLREPAETEYRMLAMQASENRARWRLAEALPSAHLSAGGAQSATGTAAEITVAAGPDR